MIDDNAVCQSIQFGEKEILFDVIFADRKRLKITVHPDQKVKVIAPINTELVDVFNRVKKRAPWILKQIQFFEQYTPLQPPRRYVSGETHVYLGRQHRLKVVKANSETVKLVRGQLKVFTSNTKDTTKVKALVEQWYFNHADKALKRRLTICFEQTRRFRLGNPEARFRKMKKRWGSCTAAGKITLNTELARAPVHCIDYVIIHELCHLRYPNHGPEFYNLLSRALPDWEARKARLEQVVISI